jgi:hypothetical protein
MLVLARSIETSVRRSPARELIGEADGTIGPIMGVASPTAPSNSGSSQAGMLIRHQPVRTVSNRVSLFVRLPVCEQCAGKVEGNSVGTRSGRSPHILPLPDRVRSEGVRIECRSRTRNAVQGEAAQRSGSNGVNQSPPIRLITSAREHDFSGYWQTLGGANRLRKALFRYKLDPGPRGVDGG